MNRKTQGIVIAGAVLGLSVITGPGSMPAAKETDSSSACISCHTNLEEMDSYGAAAAGGGGAIAG